MLFILSSSLIDLKSYWTFSIIIGKGYFLHCLWSPQLLNDLNLRWMFADNKQREAKRTRLKPKTTVMNLYNVKVRLSFKIVAEYFLKLVSVCYSSLSDLGCIVGGGGEGYGTFKESSSSKSLARRNLMRKALEKVLTVDSSHACTALRRRLLTYGSSCSASSGSSLSWGPFMSHTGWVPFHCQPAFA